MKKLIILCVVLTACAKDKSDYKLTELQKEKIMRTQQQIENIQMKAKIASAPVEQELDKIVIEVCTKIGLGSALDKCDINMSNGVVSEKKEKK